MITILITRITISFLLNRTITRALMRLWIGQYDGNRDKTGSYDGHTGPNSPYDEIIETDGPVLASYDSSGVLIWWFRSTILEIWLWQLQYIYINESWFTIILSHEKSLNRVELRGITVGVGKSSRSYQFQCKPKFKPRMIPILRGHRSAKFSESPREIWSWVR